MSGLRATFIWYELMTTDAAAAEAFYREVVGWSARDAGVPGMAYTMLSAGDAGVGGIMTLPEAAREAGARPGWIGYVAIDNIDANAARVAEAGGAVHRAPADIPGVGRFAIVADPQGATFALFRGAAESEGQAPAPGKPGHVGWHELYAADREAAFAFYSEMFGWEKADALDMGPMGIYQIFSLNGTMLGGMMTKPEAVPAPSWLYYFNVDGIELAKSRVEAGGGTILMGPQEVPGGSWIVQGRDPQGAMFALLAPRRLAD
jgi:predicted enzyme related to lactoylglutathione lyase